MKSKVKIVFASKSKDKKDIFENFLGILGQEFELSEFDQKDVAAKVIVGEEDLIRSASTKSLTAFESGDYDWGVSMEGGYCEIQGNYYLQCVVNIRTSAGSFLGVSSKIRLPQEIDDSVRRGVWLGDILDKYQDKHSKQEYTNELCQMIRTRRELFTQSLSNAILFMQHNKEISK